MLRDRRIVFAAGFARAVANGLIGVVAGIYLAELGFEPATWGAILGAGVAGTAVGAAGVMFWGDRIGRRNWLIMLGAIAAAGGAVFAFATDAVVLGAAAFLGMLNSLGKDRAAALAVLPTVLRDSAGFDHLHSLRVAVIVYAALYAVTAILYLSLSRQAEAP